MPERTFNVLFLCTHNSARSILAEALLNTVGGGRFRGYSAGSFPKGKVNPLALETLRKLDHRVDAFRSKSWEEFAKSGAPEMDIVVTVCDQAAGEVCPVWPGRPVTAHWGLPDPSAVEGTDDDRRKAFRQTYIALQSRIRILLSLPMEKLDRLAMKQKLDAIEGGKTEEAGMAVDVQVRPQRMGAGLGTFERYLTLWVALCIVAGIILGRLMPSPFKTLGEMTIAEVNISVAALIWLMIVPMLLKVDFGALRRVAEHWRGIVVTVGINWLVKPFSMAVLGWLFIGWIFRQWLPDDQIDSYIAGLILLTATPCTAMVFVWSNLTGGEPHFTLSQVALNDTIMVFAFAPMKSKVTRYLAVTQLGRHLYGGSAAASGA